MKQTRILQILHSMNRGGAENALMNFYRHIDRNAVQFDFLLTDDKHTAFEDEILSYGGKIFRIPRLKLSNPFAYMRGVYDFLISHPEYKIVHSHTSSKSVLPLWMAKLAGVPVRVCHSHAAKYAKGLRGIEQRFLKPWLKYVATDKLACGKDAAIWLYGKQDFEKGKSIVFKNVIESPKFSFNEDVRNQLRKKLEISEDTLVLGNVARLCYQKNQQFALDVVLEMKKNGIKALLLLIGTGELEDDLRAKVKQLGIQENVRFVGVVPDTYNYYQAFDVFILPSFYEGLPLVLTEAQTAGLRCFSSDTVDPDSDVTGLVSFLPLEKGAVYWANEIEKSIIYDRCSRVNDIKKAGYDAETTGKSLQEFYCKRMEELMS